MLDGNSNYRSSIDTTDFASMSVDELWELHETVEVVLAKKTEAKITVLARFLRQLNPEADIVQRGFQKPRTRGVGPNLRSYQSIANATIRNIGRLGKATALADGAA
jgi:hypothetical protein